MPKYCLNYDTGDYEWSDEDGYSVDRGEYVYKWDDSEYRCEEDDRSDRVKGCSQKGFLKNKVKLQ